MFIYNVTINITEQAHADWLKWMREVHIPEVMHTGCFEWHRILKVLHVNDEGFTYSIQYGFKNMADIENYTRNFAPQLQAAHRNRYGESYTAFRTLLEEM